VQMTWASVFYPSPTSIASFHTALSYPLTIGSLGTHTHLPNSSLWEFNTYFKNLALHNDICSLWFFF